MANQARPSSLIGWPLLALPDVNGRLNYPTLEQSVQQSIRVILSTRPGEQLMRPLFGAGLDQFIHEHNTLTTRRRIRDLIMESLQQWERRIVVDRVDVSEVADRPTLVRVEIGYRLVRTGAFQQLGLTIELEA